MLFSSPDTYCKSFSVYWSQGSAYTRTYWYDSAIDGYSNPTPTLDDAGTRWASSTVTPQGAPDTVSAYSDHQSAGTEANPSSVVSTAPLASATVSLSTLPDDQITTIYRAPSMESSSSSATSTYGSSVNNGDVQAVVRHSSALTGTQKAVIGTMVPIGTLVLFGLAFVLLSRKRRRSRRDIEGLRNSISAPMAQKSSPFVTRLSRSSYVLDTPYGTPAH